MVLTFIPWVVFTRMRLKEIITCSQFKGLGENKVRHFQVYYLGAWWNHLPHLLCEQKLFWCRSCGSLVPPSQWSPPRNVAFSLLHLALQDLVGGGRNQAHMHPYTHVPHGQSHIFLNKYLKSISTSLNKSGRSVELRFGPWVPKLGITCPCCWNTMQGGHHQET